MKRLSFRALSLTAILLYTSGLVSAQTRVPKADTQSWNDVQLTIPLSKKVDFLVQGTLRLGGNLSKAVDERWGFGFNYKLNKFVTLNELYFHREARPPNGKYEVEERLTLGVTLRKPIGKFSLIDRNWFERRWREPQVDAWRYRNRLQLEHPFKIQNAKFTWFVSDEVFSMTGVYVTGCATDLPSAPATCSINISPSISITRARTMAEPVRVISM